MFFYSYCFFTFIVFYSNCFFTVIVFLQFLQLKLNKMACFHFFCLILFLPFYSLPKKIYVYGINCLTFSVAINFTKLLNFLNSYRKRLELTNKKYFNPKIFTGTNLMGWIRDPRSRIQGSESGFKRFAESGSVSRLLLNPDPIRIRIQTKVFYKELFF